MAAAFAGWMLYLLFCGKGLKTRLRLFLPVSARGPADQLERGLGGVAAYRQGLPQHQLAGIHHRGDSAPAGGAGAGRLPFLGLTSHILEDKTGSGWRARAPGCCCCGVWAGVVRAGADFAGLGVHLAGLGKIGAYGHGHGSRLDQFPAGAFAGTTPATGTATASRRLQSQSDAVSCHQAGGAGICGGVLLAAL